MPNPIQLNPPLPHQAAVTAAPNDPKPTAPPNPNPADSSASSEVGATFADGSHLAGLVFDESTSIATHSHAPTQAPGPGEAPTASANVNAEPMNKDQFFVLFQAVFAAPGMVQKRFKPLAIQGDEHAEARQASDALYDIIAILKPSLLIPGNDIWGHALILGIFVKGKVEIAIEILRSGGPSSSGSEGAPTPAPQDTPEDSHAFNWLNNNARAA